MASNSAPQASRHVAEQIEALYLEAAEKAVRGNTIGGGGEGGEGEEGDAEGVKERDEEAKFVIFHATYCISRERSAAISRRNRPDQR